MGCLASLCLRNFWEGPLSFHLSQVPKGRIGAAHAKSESQVMPEQTPVGSKLIFRMAAWLGVVVLWELITIPPVSHSNSWQGIWISLALLPFSSFRLARSNVGASYF